MNLDRLELASYYAKLITITQPAHDARMEIILTIIHTLRFLQYKLRLNHITHSLVDRSAKKHSG